MMAALPVAIVRELKGGPVLLGNQERAGVVVGPAEKKNLVKGMSCEGRNAVVFAWTGKRLLTPKGKIAAAPAGGPSSLPPPKSQSVRASDRASQAASSVGLGDEEEKMDDRIDHRSGKGS
jgi:hypothetical protein